MPRYRPLRPERPLAVSEIYTVHYFEYSGSYAFSGEAHDFWEILYVDRGELSVTAGERSVELRQGGLIFHAPGEFHALAARGVAPFENGDFKTFFFKLPCGGKAAYARAYYNRLFIFHPRHQIRTGPILQASNS